MGKDITEAGRIFEENEVLRRTSVGIIHAPLGSQDKIAGQIENIFDTDFSCVDLLDSVTSSDVEVLTASRLYRLCVPRAASETRNSRLIFGFDPLFSVLTREAQNTVASRLSHAEPLNPFMVLVHSSFTLNRLRDEFSPERFFEWTE